MLGGQELSTLGGLCMPSPPSTTVGQSSGRVVFMICLVASEGKWPPPSRHGHTACGHLWVPSAAEGEVQASRPPSGHACSHLKAQCGSALLGPCSRPQLAPSRAHCPECCDRRVSPGAGGRRPTSSSAIRSRGLEASCLILPTSFPRYAVDDWRPLAILNLDRQSEFSGKST